jgi:hypothetical protein
MHGVSLREGREWKKRIRYGKRGEEKLGEIIEINSQQFPIPHWLFPIPYSLIKN